VVEGTESQVESAIAIADSDIKATGILFNILLKFNFLRVHVSIIELLKNPAFYYMYTTVKTSGLLYMWITSVIFARTTCPMRVLMITVTA
jgi:hypothetical protein